jgi:hypothetical protein
MLVVRRGVMVPDGFIVLLTPLPNINHLDCKWVSVFEYFGLNIESCFTCNWFVWALFSR